MPRPHFRIVCCLCRKPVPQAKDLYALDEEWQRRFPDMIGTLACPACVLGNQWNCRGLDGTFVDGHRRSASRDEAHDHDSWDHIQRHGTHAAMIISYPWPALLQGAEDYLRYTVQRRGVSARVARRIQGALDQWDAPH